MIDKIFIEPQKGDFQQICKRPKKNQKKLEETISNIFQRVNNEGDRALISFTAMYDKVEIKDLEVSAEDIVLAVKSIPESLKQAINIAKENISKFHKAQITANVNVETMKGVTCMQKSIGIERVGIYIPGGTAPLFSTVLMLSVPASLAGCKEIFLCSPPDEAGKINPAILYTANLCGVSKIYKVGGAQAIAAMTIGTESVPAVDKIFGPGNQYVTAAKQYAQKYGVGMDLPAGPSELLVYANDSGIPRFVAADLLSQAEHGIDSQVILVASHKGLIDDINLEISKQIKLLPRQNIAKKALENSKAICLEDSSQAFEFINEYGPEHLILACEDYDQHVNKITNAGSVFLGNYCPESAGDYASGTNHTLPTDGWSKSYSGVNIDSFCRKITFQEISKIGIRNIGSTVIEMANNELLAGHANAVEVRLNHLKNQ